MLSAWATLWRRQSPPGMPIFLFLQSGPPVAASPGLVSLSILLIEASFVSLSILRIEASFQERSYACVISYLHTTCLCLSQRRILFSVGSLIAVQWNDLSLSRGFRYWGEVHLAPQILHLVRVRGSSSAVVYSWSCFSLEGRNVALSFFLFLSKLRGKW